jgi:prepilin-type N-terminal cleavage/methylation domain-containing protein
MTRAGFTLAELLVAIAVMTLLMTFVAQLLNSASSLIRIDNKHMDADALASGMLDRMAVDVGQIVKRGDVSYYLKDSSSGQTQTGNDLMAFFSSVPGYESTTPSPVSLVAYRVDSATFGAERLGRGLLWNGASTTDTPMVFLPQTIPITWPNAIVSTGGDTEYESIGPGVFRFEYYYLLKSQIYNGNLEPAILSVDPWDTRLGHSSENGLSDVAAIGVAIAVVDSGSRNVVSNGQLSALAGQMNDFAATMQPGALESQWTSAIAASNLPPAATSAIRVYSRMLYLSTPSSIPTP